MVACNYPVINHLWKTTEQNLILLKTWSKSFNFDRSNTQTRRRREGGMDGERRREVKG
jgi:hypothetical protein